MPTGQARPLSHHWEQLLHKGVVAELQAHADRSHAKLVWYVVDAGLAHGSHQALVGIVPLVVRRVVMRQEGDRHVGLLDARDALGSPARIQQLRDVLAASRREAVRMEHWHRQLFSMR